MITKTALAGHERTGDELIVWRAAVARARGALSKTFEGKMEAALASFDVVPQHGRGAAGRTLSDFAAEVGISYGALDQYRQVLRWLGDFVHVYEIPSYSLARVAQVSGRWRSGAEFARFIEAEESPTGLPWTVSALRVYLNEHPRRTAAEGRPAPEPARSRGTREAAPPARRRPAVRGRREGGEEGRGTDRQGRLHELPRGAGRVLEKGVRPDPRPRPHGRGLARKVIAHLAPAASPRS